MVGGHCIGVDPYYLIDKAQRVGYVADLLGAGRLINESMGDFIAHRAIDQLVRSGCIISESRITILGLSFKENVPDLRNTRVVDIIQALQQQGVTVQIHDPHVDTEEARIEHQLELCAETALKPADCVILAVTHQFYLEKGWDWILQLLDKQRGVVMDVKGALPREEKPDSILLWRL
ncbi:UDP-N-acetyl-D-glucosamine 6-dehydrogenase [Candidatus Venteria ishoeyi]|uniref:UDP-N-acetyl-D-glucosamine 6-dehydrogenase n=1 Tax=Candidatus Venteria ishoeyi TaxID=1899563 RepID=A0A1H6FIB0_9GAMM|nr:UDP-N-acetyl-D-glucosamine 6-dehydrogenase [Candidatus Venteria ishoeyi]SEH09373.1 UDP-N-acetyl-D-glucosamine 6-dehydrogenase [Candidatus Venteria ishoeyi]